MPVRYSHITTADGSWLYTIDGSPIVIAVAEPLQISCPPDVEVVTPINHPVKVTWPSLTATGGIPPYTFSSTPVSNSEFAVGSTTVINSSVEDSFGQISECSFTVTVTLMAAVGCKAVLPRGFSR